MRDFVGSLLSNWFLGLGRCGLLALPLVCVACGDDPESVGPTEWLGAAPHFFAVGTIGGESVAVDVRGAAAADVMKLSCEREYQVPSVDGEPDWAEGKLAEFTVQGSDAFLAELPAFEVEFLEHDFQRAEPDTTITIVPRSDALPPGPSEMFLEWEWLAEDGVSTFERAASEGTFALGAVSGEPDDETGLVIPEGEGIVGGFVEARWSATEEMRVSFSAPCTSNEIETIE